MIFALIAFAVIAVGVVLGGLFSYENDWLGSLIVGAVLAALVCLIWWIIAVPGSNYNRSNCRATAEGYGLDPDEIDWSIRLGCRVTLPGGQLVNEGRIRITDDGEVLVSDEEG